MEAVPGSHAIGWDTDTEIYKRFKTMTGPDVLVVSRKWADADLARAKRLIDAYFRAVEKLAADPAGMARKTAAAGYLGADADVAEVTKAFELIVWQGAAKQKEVMSDAQLFGQAEFVSRLLVEDLGQIEQAPDFRKWVKAELIP
jgi:taurine transport system substrate-binding protein